MLLFSRLGVIADILNKSNTSLASIEKHLDLELTHHRWSLVDNSPTTRQQLATMQLDSSDGRRPSATQRLPVNPRRHKVAPEQRKRVATAYVLLSPFHIPYSPASPLLTSFLVANQMQQLQCAPGQVLRRNSLRPVRRV